MAGKHRKKTSVGSSPHKKRSGKKKPFRKMEAAKEMAFEKCKIKKGMVVRTTDKSYKVLRVVKERLFGYMYEVKEKQGDIFFLKTEPRTTDKTMQGLKSLRNEMTILKKRLLPKYECMENLPRFYDSGATDDFKFLVIQPLGENLNDIMFKHLKSAFSMSTAISTAVQTFEAINEMHALGFIHRCVSPTSFFVGVGTKVRTVYLGDFGIPYSFKDKHGKIKRPRSKCAMMGVLCYMPRVSHRREEHCRRDDLESWAYMSMEFFDLKILPWHKDRNIAKVMDKKQKTIDGEYRSIFKKIPSQFRDILRNISSLGFCERPDYTRIFDLLCEIAKSNKVDPLAPFDWEVRDKLEPDSPNVKNPASNNGVGVKPADEVSKDEDDYFPSPVSVGSGTSNEQNTPTKVPVVDANQAQEMASKPIENGKGKYFIHVPKKQSPREMPVKDQPNAENVKQPKANKVESFSEFEETSEDS